MKNSPRLISEQHFSVEGSFDLALAGLRLGFSNVLDVGFGNGGASMLFAEHGIDVTAIGINLDSYQFPRAYMESLGVEIQEVDFEAFKTGEQFEAIWASHVLEHTMNPGAFLSRTRELLADNGWLMICVPPHNPSLSGGHLVMGWSVGQLLYFLLLAGFNVKQGHFVRHGYNVCAFVQKSDELLPELRSDAGDLESLKDYFPSEIGEGVNANIQSINWFNDFRSVELMQSKIQRQARVIEGLHGIICRNSLVMDDGLSHKKMATMDMPINNDADDAIKRYLSDLEEAVVARKRDQAFNSFADSKPSMTYRIHRKLTQLLKPMKDIPVVGDAMQKANEQIKAVSSRGK